MSLKQLFAGLVLIAATAASAPAAVMLDLVYDPASTAGGGSLSTEFGAGSWHLYALDTNDDSLGISNYSVRLTDATSVLHRSPTANVDAADGNTFSAGFNLLRSLPDVNWIHAAQNLPDQTPFRINGFGQTASNFNAAVAAIDPSAVVAPTSLPTSWGNYDTAPAPVNGRNWLFLAEGTYAADLRPTISDSRIMVFNQNYSSRFSDVCVGLSCTPLAPRPQTPEPTLPPPPPTYNPPPPVSLPPDELEPPIVVIEPPITIEPPSVEEPVLQDPIGEITPPPLVELPPPGIFDRERGLHPIDGEVFYLPLRWYSHDLIVDIDSPMFADDRFLLADFDGTTQQLFYDRHLAMTSAVSWAGVVTLSGQGLNFGDSGVSEPSSALLASFALASLFATGHRQRR